MLENGLIFGFGFGFGLSPNISKHTRVVGGLSPQSHGFWSIIRAKVDQGLAEKGRNRWMKTPALRRALLCLMVSALIQGHGGGVWAGVPFQIKCGQGVEVLRLGIGSSLDQVGISSPSEANPEGPMSFDLGEKGEIYVLDQINNRVQVFAGGSRVRSLSLPKEGVFTDLAVLPEGKLALLDNFAKKSLFILNKDGSLAWSIPLEGRSIPSAQEVSGIYVQAEGKLSGIWADLGDRSVLAADLQGRPDTRRISVPGTLSADGRRLLRAEKLGDTHVILYRSEEERFSQWKEIEISAQGLVESIWEVREDLESRIYLVLGFLNEKDEPNGMVMVLDEQGRPLGSVNLCSSKMPHEIHRPFRITLRGEIYQMGLDEKGFFLKKFTPPLSLKKSKN